MSTIYTVVGTDFWATGLDKNFGNYPIDLNKIEPNMTYIINSSPTLLKDIEDARKSLSEQALLTDADLFGD